MNSKFFAAVTAALVCASSFSATEYDGDSEGNSAINKRRSTPVQVGIADPLVIPGTGYDVAGLRWSFIYGSSINLRGLDISLVGLTRENMYGLALGGVSWTDGRMCGVQAGLFGNVAGFDADGVMLSIALNNCRATVSGIQAALFNSAGGLIGIQFGALNWNSGYSAGLQAGLVNADLNEFCGGSLGIVNCTESFVGLQFGLLNIATKSGRGLQLGLFNASDKYTGVQVGLLNLIGNAPIPVFPIVNANF